MSFINVCCIVCVMATAFSMAWYKMVMQHSQLSIPQTISLVTCVFLVYMYMKFLSLLTLINHGS